jgi:hypothetical protein
MANVALPSANVITVAGAVARGVPSNLAVRTEEGAKLVAVTVTAVPAGPPLGLSTIAAVVALAGAAAMAIRLDTIASAASCLTMLKRIYLLIPCLTCHKRIVPIRTNLGKRIFLRLFINPLS